MLISYPKNTYTLGYTSNLDYYFFLIYKVACSYFSCFPGILASTVVTVGRQTCLLCFPVMYEFNDFSFKSYVHNFHTMWKRKLNLALTDINIYMHALYFL